MAGTVRYCSYSATWAGPTPNRFTILEREGVISADLARRLEAMAGFRNIAVLEYEALDPVILELIVAERLVDLEEFADQVKRLMAAG